MTMDHRVAGALAGMLALLALLALSAAAQTPGKPGLVDPNTASASELEQLPNMTRRSPRAWSHAAPSRP